MLTGIFPEDTVYHEVVRVSRYHEADGFELETLMHLIDSPSMISTDWPDPGVHRFYLTLDEVWEDGIYLTPEERLARVVGHHEFDVEEGEARPAVFTN